MNPNNVSNTNTVGAVKLANAAGGFTTGAKEINKKVEPSNPFVLFGYFFLSITIAVSIGLLLYNRYIDKQTEVILNQINKYDSEMKTTPLAEIHKLLDKLTVFSEVANKHTYVTSTFGFLEVITNKYVFWKQMDYRVNDKNKVTISLNGVAPSYYYVIQQMDEFKDPKYADYISNVELQGVALNKKDEKSKGTVEFRLKMDINKPYNNYDSNYFDMYIQGMTSSTTRVATSTNPNLILNFGTTTATSSVPMSTSTNKTSTSTKATTTQSSTSTKQLIKIKS